MFWAIGVIAVVAVVGMIVASAVLLTSGDDKPPVVAASRSASPAISSAPEPTDTYEPTTPPPSGPTDLSDVLKSTVKTALHGNVYTRITTRGGSCVSNSNAALQKVLKTHPCSAPVTAALYSNPDKSIRVSIFIMQFDSSSDASAVNSATSSDASPGLISPPRPVEYWTLSRTVGSRVVYGVACKTAGGKAGTNTGPVNAAGKELSVEIANVLLFTN
jgi:hypothetical protein